MRWACQSRVYAARHTRVEHAQPTPSTSGRDGVIDLEAMLHTGERTARAIEKRLFVPAPLSARMAMDSDFGRNQCRSRATVPPLPAADAMYVCEVVFGCLSVPLRMRMQSCACVREADAGETKQAKV